MFRKYHRILHYTYIYIHTHTSIYTYLLKGVKKVGYSREYGGIPVNPPMLHRTQVSRGERPGAAAAGAATWPPAVRDGGTEADASVLAVG